MSESIEGEGAEFDHTTVMREQTVAFVAPRSGGLYVDVTCGGGGHTQALLEASAPDGKVIAFDRDEVALAAAKERLAKYGERVRFIHSRFGLIADHIEEASLDGLIADLGVSSPQLDDAARGFSFRGEGPLDMRMDASKGKSARELIEELSQEALADVIYEYGEERRSRAIARSIKARSDAGDLNTTSDLAHAIYKVTGPKRGRLDPATRSFQALRVAVNDELGELKTLLDKTPDLLKDGGVVAIISFHSLEDRPVKFAFRDDERLERITKKVVRAEREEQVGNRRSRSAKLRAARRRLREVAA